MTPEAPTDAEIAVHVATDPAGPRAGTCTDCGQRVWRTVEHPRLGTTLLWPDPASLYARVWCAQGPVVGIAYCVDCCPDLGADLHPSIALAVWTDATRTDQRRLTLGVVMHHDRATERYAYWYTDAYGRWLHAWLAQEIQMDAAGIAAMMAQWTADVEYSPPDTRGGDSGPASQECDGGRDTDRPA